jgi:hypothetical protein
MPNIYAAHPSRKAAKDEAPTVRFAIGRLGRPPSAEQRLVWKRATDAFLVFLNELSFYIGMTVDEGLQSYDKKVMQHRRCLSITTPIIPAFVQI